MADGATLLDPFPARVQAMATLVTAVADYKLKAAQADLTEAVAAGQWVRAQILQTVLEQLQNDLTMANRARYYATIQAAALRERAHSASMLLQGTQIAAYDYAAGNYKYFERQALIEGDEALFAGPKSGDTIVTLSGGAADFLDNRDPLMACEELSTHPVPVLNGLQLMAWALERQYIARTGTASQFQFVKLFKQIAQVAQRTMDSIEQTRDAVVSGVYNVWQPVKIVGAAPTDAERRILESTGPNVAS